MRDLVCPSFRSIDQDIRTLDAEQMIEENSLLPNDADGRAERILRVYLCVRSLLTALSMTPTMNPAWRAALAFFIRVCDAAASSGPVEGFKAGRDL